MQIRLIRWMHILSLEFESCPFVIGDYLWVWHLCLEKFHVHSAPLNVEFR
jgi:hypothetical protein